MIYQCVLPRLLFLLVLTLTTGTLALPCAAAAQDLGGRLPPDLMATGVGAAASDDGQAQAMESPRFWRAAGGALFVNAVVWSYDRFIREGGENPVFRVGFNSWRDNLEAGWTWDDNNFATNQFAHPYHGNLYFNSARSNGYNFWQSIPFAFAGSYVWEFFGEVHNASMNDWISTSLGGVALGEITHRFATTVRDNRASGGSRQRREVAGMFIDPVGGLNRLLDGNWSRSHANPANRFPNAYRSRLDIGLRTKGEERLWEADTTRAYIDLAFDYGDPFEGDLGQPYDHFDFEAELTFGDKTTLGYAAVNGNLAGVFVKESDRVNHLVAAYHRFEYMNNNALEFGGQTITAALASQWRYDNGLELRTTVEAGPMILAGMSSDYESVSGRSYDYGPGSTVMVDLELRSGAWTWLRLFVAHAWMHSISGNAADHHVVDSRLRMGVPIRSGLGLGLEFQVLNAERKYRDYEDVSRRVPHMRVFTSWALQ